MNDGHGPKFSQYVLLVDDFESIVVDFFEGRQLSSNCVALWLGGCEVLGV